MKACSSRDSRGLRRSSRAIITIRLWPSSTRRRTASVMLGIMIVQAAAMGAAADLPYIAIAGVGWLANHSRTSRDAALTTQASAGFRFT